MATWRPDDSLLDAGARGETKGSRRVKDALRKRGMRPGNRIVTSRDPGMAAARNDLKRSGMPPGVQQWQLPIAVPVPNLLVFTSTMKAGARVPEHVHKVWVFRVVTSGTLKYGGKTLKAGDWMMVPPGQAYSISAGTGGCTIFYAHCLPPPPPPGPPGG
jgi:quercetin dioxygenase-like cupin family protein